MTRPGFLLLTVAACLLGLSLSWQQGNDPWHIKAVITVFLAVIAHAGANVLNDYHDARNGTDAANQDGLFPFSGGSRLIQQGIVTERETAILAAWLLLALIPAGLLLVWFSGIGLLWIGMAGVFFAWAYSAPPFALMTRGLGELSVAMAWWLVVLGADYVQRQAFAIEPAYTGISFALLTANLLLINGFPDATSDAQTGKNTLVVRLGKSRAAWLYVLLTLLAYGGLILFVQSRLLPTSSYWGLVSFPLSLAASFWLVRYAHTPQRLRFAVILTIAATLLHALALAIGVIMGSSAV